LGGYGGEAGSGGEACSQPSDCPGDDADCEFRSCTGGMCGLELAAVGTVCDEDGGNMCDGAGSCLKSNGTGCVDASECVSKTCSDNVCCDAACDGGCESCAIDSAEGTCTPYPANSDPETECAEGLCDGSGACTTGKYQWSAAVGDAGSFQQSWAVAVDAAGFSRLVGHFDGELPFFAMNPLVAQGGTDLFVAKLKPNGTPPPIDNVVTWGFGFGGAQDDRAFGIAIGMSNDAFVTGHFRGELNFTNIPSNALSTAGDFDIFVAKLNTNGVHQWSKRFGDTSDQFGYKVAVDSQDNVVLFGSFSGSVNFGGNDLDATDGGPDLFVAKLDTDGTHIWSKRFGDAAIETAFDVAVDSSDGILLTGGFEGTVDFGATALSTAGASDIYIVKLDNDGNEVWAQRFGDGASQQGIAIDVDNDDNVLATGEFGGTVDFGGNMLSTSAGDRNVYVVKLDGGGQALVSRSYGTTAGDQFPREIACDVVGNIIVVGAFADELDFGGDPLASSEALDMFVAKLASDLTHLWSDRFGGAGDQFANGVDTAPNGDVLFTGTFENDLTIVSDTHPNQGGEDIFIARFEP